MKTIKMILTGIGAAAVLNIAAMAGDLVPVQISNGHGQIVVLYRATDTSVALYTGGRGVGTSAAKGELKATSKDNGHGQAVTLYRAE